MKKPKLAVIRGALPLSRLPTRPADPITACNVCGKADVAPAILGLGEPSLGLWREHDESDQPVAGPDARVYLHRSHRACMEALEKHPRLYIEETGVPGTYPALCGDCTRREGARCTHPSAKANGGPGLQIETAKLGLRGLVCLKGAPPIIPRAITCFGRSAIVTSSSSEAEAEARGEPGDHTHE